MATPAAGSLAVYAPILTAVGPTSMGALPVFLVTSVTAGVATMFPFDGGAPVTYPTTELVAPDAGPVAIGRLADLYSAFGDVASTPVAKSVLLLGSYNFGGITGYLGTVDGATRFYVGSGVNPVFIDTTVAGALAQFAQPTSLYTPESALAAAVEVVNCLSVQDGVLQAIRGNGQMTTIEGTAVVGNGGPLLFVQAQPYVAGPDNYYGGEVCSANEIGREVFPVTVGIDGAAPGSIVLPISVTPGRTWKVVGYTSLFTALSPVVNLFVIRSEDGTQWALLSNFLKPVSASEFGISQPAH